MKNINIERVLEIIENGEYTKIEPYVLLGETLYNVTTNKGGKIRLIHANKVWFTKEYVEVILFVPNKKDFISCEKYESNHELFNRVYEAWDKIRNEYKNNKSKNYSKFF